jgi:hypothetical protein
MFSSTVARPRGRHKNPRRRMTVDSRPGGPKPCRTQPDRFIVPNGYSIQRLGPPAIRAKAPELAEVLVDCVQGGASVSFMGGLNLARAERFWRDMAGRAESDGRTVLAAVHDSDFL